MPNLSIKNVPASVVAKLRRRAKRNHRSLQGELMVIVHEAAAGRTEPAAASIVDRVRGGTRTVEQIAAEHRARRPHAFTQGPLAVDIVRADRDAR